MHQINISYQDSKHRVFSQKAPPTTSSMWLASRTTITCTRRWLRPRGLRFPPAGPVPWALESPLITVLHSNTHSVLLNTPNSRRSPSSSKDASGTECRSFAKSGPVPCASCSAWLFWCCSWAWFSLPFFSPRCSSCPRFV